MLILTKILKIDIKKAFLVITAKDIKKCDISIANDTYYLDFRKK